jgi:hypothetical protein
MTAPDVDPIRAFSTALTPAARAHLRLDHTTIPVIRQATQTTTPRDLAKTVSTGIGWHTPANPWPLMWHRIRRAAGQNDTDTRPAEEPA